MCVSLSKDRIDQNDDWEQTKKERAGSGMVKFVRKNSDLIKEEEDEDDIGAMKVNAKSGKRTEAGS
jgi:DNA cross-link repair 1A protein